MGQARMELEQLLKRLEWLDEEHRKDKTMIVTLEERLLALEGKYAGVPPQIQELSSEITRLATAMGRMDGFETTLAQMRV